MLGKLLTAVDEPEFMLIALHLLIPAVTQERLTLPPDLSLCSTLCSAGRGFCSDGRHAGI